MLRIKNYKNSGADMEDKQAEQTIQIPPSISAQFGDGEEWKIFKGTVRNIADRGDVILGDTYYKNVALMIRRDPGSNKWTAYNITTKMDVRMHAASRHKKRNRKRKR